MPSASRPEVEESFALGAFAYIDAEGHIPTTPLRLKPLALGWSLVGAASWTAYIQYTDNNRNDRSATFSGQSPTWSPIGIDFQGLCAGGDIHLEVTGTARDDRTGAVDNLHWAGTNTIRGTNADDATVKSRLGDLFSKVVAYKESRFKHFLGDGLPKWGPPDGFGLMQIDRHPDPATSAQIWNWKQNCDDGKALATAGRQTIAQHYRNQIAAHPTLPALSGDRLKFAEYQYYNAGNKGFYWIPNADFTDWRKNDPAYTAYGDDAVRIETAVVAGNPPADW